MINKILKTIRGFSPVELVIMVGFGALAAAALIYLATTPHYMAQQPVNVKINVDSGSTVARQPGAQAAPGDTNPDPTHIDGNAGDSTITVYPTGSSTVGTATQNTIQFCLNGVAVAEGDTFSITDTLNGNSVTFEYDLNGDGVVSENNIAITIPEEMVPLKPFFVGTCSADPVPYTSTDEDGDGQLNEDPVDGVDNDGDGATDEDPDDSVFAAQIIASITASAITSAVDNGNLFVGGTAVLGGLPNPLVPGVAFVWYVPDERAGCPITPFPFPCFGSDPLYNYPTARGHFIDSANPGAITFVPVIGDLAAVLAGDLSAITLGAFGQNNTGDLANVQWAVDNVADGGTVILETYDPDDNVKKAFDFTFDSTNNRKPNLIFVDRQFVNMQGVKLSGAVQYADQWSETDSANTAFETPDGTLMSDRTVVWGGGTYGQMNSTALPAITSSFPGGMYVSGLRFDNYTMGAAGATGVPEEQGFKITDSIFTNIKLGKWIMFDSYFNDATAVVGFFSNRPILGSTTIEHNYYKNFDGLNDPDLLNMDPDVPTHSSAFEYAIDFKFGNQIYFRNNTVKNAGISDSHFFACPFSGLWIQDNNFYNSLIAKENFATGTAIAVTSRFLVGFPFFEYLRPGILHAIGNTITGTSAVASLDAAAAIEVGALHDGSEIKNNIIESAGAMPAGITVFSGAPNCLNELIPGTPYPTCSLFDYTSMDIDITGNTLKGIMDKGIYLYGKTNGSEDGIHGLLVSNNNLLDLTAGTSQIVISDKVYDSKITGNKIGSLAESGLAGIEIRGDKNEIYNNEFRDSDIMGLKNGDQTSVALLAEPVCYSDYCDEEVLIQLGVYGKRSDLFLCDSCADPDHTQVGFSALPENNYVKEQGDYMTGTGGATFQVYDGSLVYCEENPSDELCDNVVANRVIGLPADVVAQQTAEHPGIGQINSTHKTSLNPDSTLGGGYAIFFNEDATKALKKHIPQVHKIYVPSVQLPDPTQ